MPRSDDEAREEIEIGPVSTEQGDRRIARPLPASERVFRLIADYRGQPNLEQICIQESA